MLKRMIVATAAAALAAAGMGAPPYAQAEAGRPSAEPRAEPSLHDLRRRAATGDAEAQNELGARLLQSEDPAHHEEARRVFESAAAAGDAEAKNNLATVMALGIGGPADEGRGRALREEAARLGSVGAHLSLAEHYLRGVGGYPRDPSRAFEHVRTAAALASPIADYAQWRLAMMHLEGVGTARDPVEAYRLLVIASDAGGVHAMISRAVMLATGEGVAEDDAAARSLYRRAAESGEVRFAHALRGLGAMLVTGEGGSAALPRGIAYLRIAPAGGDADARTLLERWDDRITPEVHAEAVRISEAWIAEHLPGD